MNPPFSKHASWALALVLTALGAASSLQAKQGDDNPSETPAERQARMQWWHDAKFGMFVHWGVYAHSAGSWNGKSVPGWSEWIMLKGKIPVADYLKMAAEFNPEKFNAETWAAIAKNAGIKYIVLTAKHHDGFAMYPSKVSPYNIAKSTPFKRDPVGELAQACKKEGLRLGLYYSQAQDWLNKGSAEGGHWDPAQDGSMDDYLKNVAVPQIRELLTQYGPIAEWWWDAPVDMTNERAKLVAPEPKSLQPQIITNSRAGRGYAGDMEVFEGRIPLKPYEGDWETCMTMNGSWGFKQGWDNYPPAENFIRNLVDVVSKGGNFLLNVGPDGNGEIPEGQVKILKAMGDWLAVNGEAIYGTTASPFVKPLPWGKITQKPGKAYLHIITWPKDGSLVIPIANQPGSARLLAKPAEPLKVSQQADGVHIQLPPAGAQGAAVTVVALDITGNPTPLPQQPITPGENGSLVLPAEDSSIKNRVEAGWDGDEQNISIANWKNPKESVTWPVQITKAGKYKVIARYGAENAEGGEFLLTIGGQTITGQIHNTQARNNLQDAAIGTLNLTAPVTDTVEMKVTNMPGRWNFRSITLSPEK